MDAFKKHGLRSNNSNLGNKETISKKIEANNEYKVIFDFQAPNGGIDDSEGDNAYGGIEDDLWHYSKPIEEQDMPDKISSNIDDNPNNYIDDKKEDDGILFPNIIKAVQKRIQEDNLEKSSFYLKKHTIEFYNEYASLHKMKYSAMVRIRLEAIEEALKNSNMDPFSQ